MTRMEKKSNPSKKIRKGDHVIAISGNSKGLSGVVQSCEGEKIIVQGLNYRKKHVKPTQSTKGKIIDLERPIHVSNLKIYTNNETAVKLKVSKDHDGHRQFVYEQDGKEVVYRQVKKPK